MSESVPVKFENRVMGSNQLVPGTTPSTYTIVAGTKIELGEPGEISHTEGTGENQTVTRFKRLFWTYKNKYFIAQENAEIPGRHVNGSGFTVTCWYIPMGGGGTYITTHTFSLSENIFVDDICIESVDPPEAWDGTSSFAPHDSELTLNYKKYLNGEVFKHYWRFGGNKVSNPIQNVPANEGTFTYVFYGPEKTDTVGLPPKDYLERDWEGKLPLDILDQVADPGPIDLRALLLLGKLMNPGSYFTPMTDKPMEKENLMSKEIEVEAEIKKLNLMKDNISKRLSNL